MYKGLERKIGSMRDFYRRRMICGMSLLLGGSLLGKRGGKMVGCRREIWQEEIWKQRIILKDLDKLNLKRKLQEIINLYNLKASPKMIIILLLKP